MSQSLLKVAEASLPHPTPHLIPTHPHPQALYGSCVLTTVSHMPRPPLKPSHQPKSILSCRCPERAGLTLTLRWWTLEGWHLTLLVLQQPVQRFTSTHGGQIRKLADVGSTWLRGIS